MPDLRQLCLHELADELGDRAARCEAWAPAASAALVEAAITLRLLAEWPGSEGATGSAQQDRVELATMREAVATDAAVRGCWSCRGYCAECEKLISARSGAVLASVWEDGSHPDWYCSPTCHDTRLERLAMSTHRGGGLDA
jgi:hypothetical protein